MSLEKEFIPYKEALELKELGFKGFCFALFDKDGDLRQQNYKGYVNDSLLKEVTAPTYSQAFSFFREKYKLHYPIAVSDGVWFYDKWNLGGYKTYEEAQSACLKKLIEIVKNK